MYETGLAVAFCLYAFNAIYLVVLINSTLNKNLRKIGKRISWLTLTPEPMDDSHLKTSGFRLVAKYILLQSFSLVLVLLSWVYVAISIGGIVFRIMKDYGKPQSFKELAWKMKNIDMSFDQIIEELAKAAGLNDQKKRELRAQVLDEMEASRLIPARRKIEDHEDSLY